MRGGASTAAASTAEATAAKPAPEAPAAPAEEERAARRANGTAQAPAPARPAPSKPAPQKSAPEKPAAGSASKAARPAPAVEEGTATPLRGAASAVVKNMQASLEVPTATSVRAVPAKLLADNRLVINNQLRRTRGGKISFTHLIGFAVVRALAEYPGR